MPKILNFRVLALVVTVSLLMAVGAVTFVVGNAASSEADIGVGSTNSLADGGGKVMAYGMTSMLRGGRLAG